MRVLVTGASGLLGSALVRALKRTGDETVRLTRSKPRADRDEIAWDPAAGKLDGEALEGLDAVVHLAGESLAGLWTDEKKERIRESRVQGTRLLVERLVGARKRPKVLVSASAVGYYGDRGDELLAEDSNPGTGFLPDVCRKWESAAAEASRVGIRVVNTRFGLILGADGGILGAMLPAFRFGFGGKLGSGRQYMSWITVDDAIGVIRHAIAMPSLKGPVNAAAPESVTNEEFADKLGHVLRRPTILSVPEPILRLAPGEMAGEMILASVRAEPAALLESGYAFEYPDLEPALRHVLRKHNGEDD